MAFNGVTFDFEINLGDPLTATLDVKYEADTFSATLSSPIRSTNITLSSLAVTGYDDGSCTNLSGDSDSSSGNMTITAGNYNGNVAGLYGMTTNTLYYNFSSITVNGTSRNNGDSFTIGGTTVTIYYPQNGYSGCDPYFD